MRYSKIRKIDVSNGEGVGVALFVQGCPFHCKGCFNQETWDFQGGKEFTGETFDQLADAANKPYIKRISILGGEPLCDDNVNMVFSIIRSLQAIFPEKRMWLYTGYKIEDIVHNRENGDSEFSRFLSILQADVVVDGPFQLENQDLFNKSIVFAGSTNQRVLRHEDIKKIVKELTGGKNEKN